MRILLWLSTCLALLICTCARAALRFERFLPENPTADSEVQVEIWFSGRTTAVCDYPVATAFEEVTLNGSTIRARFITNRLPTASGGLCSTAGPNTTFVRTYSLSRFPPGQYTFELIGRDLNSPTRPLIQVANVPLSIAGSTFVQVPADNGFGLALLAIGLLVFGLHRLRTDT